MDLPELDPDTPRANLGRLIPRRPRVAWWLGLALAVVFAALITPVVTADRWAAPLLGTVEVGQPAPVMVRVPPFAGPLDTVGGGFVVERGVVVGEAEFAQIQAAAATRPSTPLAYGAVFIAAFVFAAVFSHHMRRSTLGRLRRVQLVALGMIVAGAVAVKALLLFTPLSVFVVPVALISLIGTMVLDRVVGLATGILAALVFGLVGPFDLGVFIMLLVQAATAGLVVPERPRRRWRAALLAGLVTTVLTAVTYVLVTYLMTGALPALVDPLVSPLLAAAAGPAIATLLAVPLTPLYQRFVGEITQATLIELEDLSNPLLRQIAERAPGSWQHSLMMANMAEIAANAIGADGRLVRVGALYHDLGKSLSPKYFIENLEPGEPSPHDRLAPEASCNMIFLHVTDGIAAARKAGLHERVVDFMHMHHGDGILEYFWGKCREQGNPHKRSIEEFRYPGHPPQSRETAILAICDAVEAASRTLKKPDPAQIDALVQRIVYGKLHLGQLDESGLSMADLRRISDSLRETIRHANHGRIEYPWQKVGHSEPRLDSLDRRPQPQVVIENVTPTGPQPIVASPSASMPIELGASDRKQLGIADTADVRPASLAIIETAPMPASKKPVETRLEVPALPSDGEISPSTFVNPPAARRRTEHSGLLRPPVPGPAPGMVTLQGPNAPTRLPATPVTLAGTPVGELENGITNPPPMRSTAEPVPPVTVRPVTERRVTEPVPIAAPPSTHVGHASGPITSARRPPPSGIDPSAGRTDPSMPSFGASGPASSPWSTGLAARVDAIVSKSEDEWHAETPIMPPTRAELQALLGAADSTKRQSVDEIERLHRATRELHPPGDDLILQRRVPPITAEVAPEDIEAAIDAHTAPPRRTQNLIAVAKPKKSE